MKKTKILIVALLAACPLWACAVAAQTVPTDKEQLVARVKHIYNKVFAVYARAENDLSVLNDTNFDGLYCSDDWNQTVAKVTEKDSKNDDEIGFFDADYWVMGQDFSELSISDVAVESINGSRATVVMMLHNCGSATPVRLTMVYERGNWFIDDFFEDYDASGPDTASWKNSMLNYLKEP